MHVLLPYLVRFTNKISYLTESLGKANYYELNRHLKQRPAFCSQKGQESTKHRAGGLWQQTVQLRKTTSVWNQQRRGQC